MTSQSVKRMILMAIFLPLTGFSVLRCSMMEKKDETNLLKPPTTILSNGLMILWLKDPRFPRVGLQLAIRAGSVYESEQERGYHHMTGVMLREGTSKRSSEALNEELETLAINFSVTTREDSMVLQATALSEMRKELLQIFFEILTEPSFEAQDFKRKKKMVLNSMLKVLEDPSRVLDLALRRQVWGDHPYSFPDWGRPETVSKMTHKDAIRIFKLFFQPQRSALVVYGDYDQNFVQEVQAIFGSWRSLEPLDFSVPKVSETTPKIKVYHREGLEQTQIGWAIQGPKRSDPDFIPLRLGNMAFGGAFASRLNQKIRDDLGLTYGIHSHFEFLNHSGSFEITTFTRHEKIYDMVTHVQKEYERWVQEGITQEELDASKAVFLGQFPLVFQSMDSLSSSLLNLWVMGVDLNYLANFKGEVEKVSLDQVNSSIRRHLGGKKLHTVIYTDAKKNKKALEKLGVKEFSEFKL